MASVAERVTRVLVEQLGVAESEASPEALLVDRLNVDSLDGVEIVMALEEEFGIEIPDEDTGNLLGTDEDCTVAEIVSYLERRLSV